MKRVFKKIRFLLIIWTTFCFIVFPVYPHLYVFEDRDTNFPYLCYKAIGQQDYSVATLERKEKISIPIFAVKQHVEINPLFEHIPDFYFHVFAPCSKSLILRC